MSGDPQTQNLISDLLNVSVSFLTSSLDNFSDVYSSEVKTRLEEIIRLSDELRSELDTPPVPPESLTMRCEVH